MTGELAFRAATAAIKPSTAMAKGTSFAAEPFPAVAISARSRFQPQRAQNGLFSALNARRSVMGEPQRGQVMVLIPFILEGAAVNSRFS